MGQKTHPYGLRLGIIKSWRSRWFATKNFAELLGEDLLIRRYINKRLEHAGVAEVEILRAPKKVTIDIYTAKPGIVIGRKGAEVDKLKEELQMLTGKEIMLNIIEVKKPELSATLVAQQIARQLEGRVSFRRAMKKAIAAAMKSGAEGIKIICSGRLAGAEIARSEKYHQGRVPLHTLRADIDYAQATAHTTYGTIGVKVWICRGEIIEKEKAEAKLLGERVTEQEAPRGERRPRDHREAVAAGTDSGGKRTEERRRRRGGQKAQAPKPRKPSAKELDKSRQRQSESSTSESKQTTPDRKSGGSPSDAPPERSSEGRS